MTTRELIQAQLDRLDNNELQRVHQFIEQMTTPESIQQSDAGLMAKLRTLQIDGPRDFAENVDDYLNRANHESSNLP